MPKKDQNEELDSRAVEKLEEKIKNRERKKRKRMPVSGKGVFKIKGLKDKQAKDLSKDED